MPLNVNPQGPQTIGNTADAANREGAANRAANAAHVAAGDLFLEQQNHERSALPIIFSLLLLGAGFGNTIPTQINNAFPIVSDSTLIHVQLICKVLGAAIGVCTGISALRFRPE